MNIMMKKSIFWKITGLAALIFGLGAGFTSCHDNIYSMIEMRSCRRRGSTEIFPRSFPSTAASGVRITNCTKKI